MKHQGYFTRALQARDQRYARVFEKLGYRTADLVPNDGDADINALRDLYEKVAGTQDGALQTIAGELGGEIEKSRSRLPAKAARLAAKG